MNNLLEIEHNKVGEDLQEKQKWLNSSLNLVWGERLREEIAVCEI